MHAYVSQPVPAVRLAGCLRSIRESPSGRWSSTARRQSVARGQCYYDYCIMAIIIIIIIIMNVTMMMIIIVITTINSIFTITIIIINNSIINVN